MEDLRDSEDPEPCLKSPAPLHKITVVAAEVIGSSVLSTVSELMPINNLQSTWSSK